MATMPGLLREPHGPKHGRPTPDSGISVRSDSRYSESLSTSSYDNSLHESANDDSHDTESGVHEQDCNEWIFQDYGENVELDLTPDQVMATLRYFTSTAERANMLTKTHFDDLDIISDLLQEKEKDLEMAANIGQSLLQRNKDLLLKIEAMEDYLSQASEREVQLCHEVQLKNKLIKHMLLEEEEIEAQSMSSGSSYKNANEVSCKDETMTLLQQRCKNLEVKNNELFSEALSVKHLTDEAEAKEQELVMDCIRQLSEAKEQITNLTDEIALKFEDNVQQQEEITELITTVVELQRNHRQLSTENEDLQLQLDESQQNQEFLRTQVIELQRKFCECYELLQNNQEEMKILRSKVELSEQGSWASESCSSGFYQDSIAMEIEESVRKDLTSAEAKRRQDNKVWDTIRRANRLLEKGTDSRPHSGRLSPMSGSRSELQSFVSDDSSMSDAASMTHSGSYDVAESSSSRRRRPYAPERLQIVKPMEGSQTLHQWQHLASQNVNAGLNLTESPNSSPEEKDISGIRLEDLDDDIFHEDGASTADEGISFMAKPVRNQMPHQSAGAVRKKTPTINPQKPVVVKAGVLPGKNKSSTPKSTVAPTVILEKPDSRPSSKTHADDMSIESQSSSLKPDMSTKQSKNKSRAKPRTIITRSSSILASLREGREMLSQNDNGKSKAEVIDIIANAMNKVNVEAQTGKRILQSLSANNVQDRKQSMSRTPSKKEYPDMPKLSKVLEKLAATKVEENEEKSGSKPSLRDLITKMESGAGKTKIPETKMESLPPPKMLGTMANATLSGPGAVLPTILRGTLQLGRSSTPSLFGRMVRSSSHDVQNAPSETSFSAIAGSSNSSPHRTLTKSLSSGDLQKFAAENLSKLGVIDPNVTSSAVNLGRVRRNSSGDSMGNISSVNSIPEVSGIKRRNSSGNLAALLRKSEDSNEASPPSSFSSFDPYGITEYFGSDSKGRSAAAKGAVAVPKVPSGFLKNLFLGSGTANEGQKRPSSVIEQTRDMREQSKGTAGTSSAESGLDKFGRAFNIGDSFGGLGFMSLFGNKGSSNEKK